MGGLDAEYEFKDNHALETVELMAVYIGGGAKVEIENSPVCDLSHVVVALLACSRLLCSSCVVCTYSFRVDSC